MWACLLFLCALELSAAPALDEPLWDALDEELFAMIAAGSGGDFTPEQQRRLRFWEWYYRHRAHLQKVHEGAVLRDDFNAVALDEFTLANDSIFGAPRLATKGTWRAWDSDPGIHVAVADGLLAIKGRSSVTSADQNFNGLVSRRFGDTDVVLVVDMKTISPAEDSEGTHLAMVHLCGSVPDLFHELRFGRSRDGTVGWSQYHRSEIVASNKLIDGREPFGDEQDRFHTVRLEHDAATEVSSSWVQRDGVWVEIGEGRRAVLSSTTVELKVNMPEAGMEVECYFDNCRLYGSPATHPVRFLVSSALVGPTDVHGVAISVFLDGSVEPTVSGLTNELGWADLQLPSDRIYPATARVRFTLTTGETWDRDIAQAALEGLYPGDVWVAHLNVLDVTGDDDWWQRVRNRSAQGATGFEREGIEK